jgi:molybdopterin-guanine dinucleotide biosynthesis protein A
MSDKFNREEGTSLLDLPVFQLTGGSQEERKHFAQYLLTTLKNNMVSAAVVSENLSGSYSVVSLAKQHDLVLINGAVEYPVQKIGCGVPHDESDTHLFWRGDGHHSMDEFVEKLIAHLNLLINRIPVWACVLIGGKSSRMGRPKHLIGGNKGTGESWLEQTLERVRSFVDGVAISGEGSVPEPLGQIPRIPDIPGVAGPLSGLLASFRWQPASAWIFIACDMPLISEAALQWLLDGRRTGSWGRVPRFADAKYCEPLFALYEYQAAAFFEEQLLSNRLRIGEVGRHSKIENPIIPKQLSAAWRNVNTPEQLQRIKSE